MLKFPLYLGALVLGLGFVLTSPAQAQSLSIQIDSPTSGSTIKPYPLGGGLQCVDVTVSVTGASSQSNICASISTGGTACDPYVGSSSQIIRVCSGKHMPQGPAEVDAEITDFSVSPAVTANAQPVAINLK